MLGEGPVDEALVEFRERGCGRRLALLFEEVGCPFLR
jgi:hypothetical protein